MRGSGCRSSRRRPPGGGIIRSLRDGIAGGLGYPELKFGASDLGIPRGMPSWRGKGFTLKVHFSLNSQNFPRRTNGVPMAAHASDSPFPRLPIGWSRRPVTATKGGSVEGNAP
jgi:hypothetical protein